MEAISKTGKRLHGKIAEILVKKGSATPIEDPKDKANRLAAEKEAKRKEAAEKAKKANEEAKIAKLNEAKHTEIDRLTAPSGKVIPVNKGSLPKPKKVVPVKKVAVRKVKK